MGSLCSKDSGKSSSGGPSPPGQPTAGADKMAVLGDYKILVLAGAPGAGKGT